jgi:hypothetical protein
VDPDETSLLNTLAQRYEQLGGSGNYAPPVFSMTKTVFLGEGLATIKFPLYTGLLEYIRNTTGELHISDKEREWADNWLRERGVSQGDFVIVVLDTASGKEKMLNTPVYFEFLQFLLRGRRVRVLNFDERGLGKEEFYKAWLGDQTDKMIFSRNLSLREAVCLLSASSVRMIFGPCTGLMHCASAIYNYYKKMGMDGRDIPIMITYTGRYQGQESASEWWSNSPLIDCIMLKARDNGDCSLVKLSDLSPEDQAKNDSLPCNRYTTGHLTNFVRASFQERAASPW